MTFFTGIVFGTEFVDDDFAGAGVTHDRRGDVGVFHNGFADFEGFPFANSKNIEFYGGTDFGIQFFDAQDIVLADAILFPTCADHSVHVYNLNLVKNARDVVPDLNTIRAKENFARRKDGAS